MGLKFWGRGAQRGALVSGGGMDPTIPGGGGGGGGPMPGGGGGGGGGPMPGGGGGGGGMPMPGGGGGGGGIPMPGGGGGGGGGGGWTPFITDEEGKVELKALLAFIVAEPMPPIKNGGGGGGGGGPGIDPDDWPAQGSEAGGADERTELLSSEDMSGSVCAQELMSSFLLLP